jgi:hypothetical protein
MSLESDILSQAGDLLELSAMPEKKEPVTCVVEFSLLPEHLADYVDQHGKLASAQKGDEKDVQALRARHHGVARLLAEGVPEGVIAEMTGYTAAYISTLKNTPAMIDLVAFYRSPKNETAKVIGERLRTVADMSLELIEQRLETKGGEISISELTAVSKLGFDRSGHGPQSTVHNIEEHRLVMPEELVELSRNARARDRSKIVDVSAVRGVLPSPEKLEAEHSRSDDGSDTADSGAAVE